MHWMSLIPVAGMSVLIQALPSSIPAAITSCGSSELGKMMLSSPIQQGPG